MSGRVKGVSGEVVDVPGFIGRLGLMGISIARSIHVDLARRGRMFGESTLTGSVTKTHTPKKIFRVLAPHARPR